MKFEREYYIEKLISSKHNHLIKIVTGLRRVGKSYLLLNLYKQHLLDNDVDTNHIIEIKLDSFAHRKYRKAETLYEYIENLTKQDSQMYYVIIDEVQMLEDFVDVLNGFLHIDNLDVYVTGSNAKFLSSDIVTEFRGRGVQIHLQPLSFKEIKEKSNEGTSSLWRDYIYYGGLPMVVIEKDKARKAEILQELLKETYLSDIIDRNNVKNDAELEELFSLLASNIGALTNPNKLANTAGSLMGQKPSYNTIKNYLDYVENSYLFQSAKRWNVKGRKYFDTIQKYYAMDLGLRNARLNFRQQERSHLMENLIYNELIRRGYSVDVGVVELSRVIDGKRKQSQYEIDFVVNIGNDKVYIQSALNVDTQEKKDQETFSLRNTGDFFRKIVVLDGSRKPWTDDDGVMYIGVIPFLLKDILTDILK